MSKDNFGPEYGYTRITIVVDKMMETNIVQEVILRALIEMGLAKVRCMVTDTIGIGLLEVLQQASEAEEEE